jgi:hypothetical protein
MARSSKRRVRWGLLRGKGRDDIRQVNTLAGIGGIGGPTSGRIAIQLAVRRATQ